MSPWTGSQPLLLASTSPTRRLLLESAGLPVETRAPEVDERAVEAQAKGAPLDPPALALLLAREKALEVSRRHPGRPVLGADQVLAEGGTVFHKPVDRAEARAHLLRLAGRTHALHSAAVLAEDGRPVAEVVDSAHLTMRALGPEAIDRYLDLAGPAALGSVGAYRLEGLGIHLFERVAGDHATVLGLPLLPLLAALRRLGHLNF